jgi:hypothetical protein
LQVDGGDVAIAASSSAITARMEMVVKGANVTIALTSAGGVQYGLTQYSNQQPISGDALAFSCFTGGIGGKIVGPYKPMVGPSLRTTRMPWIKEHPKAAAVRHSINQPYYVRELFSPENIFLGGQSGIIGSLPIQDIPSGSALNDPQ